MSILQKVRYAENWNIGFCEQTPTELLLKQGLNKIEWLKHSYKDRWFADPFIYKVTDTEIVVFIEECPIENSKGILCELVVDRKSKVLKERYVLLELDTHLSYPCIIKHEGKTYVYPENGASGQLNLYEYDENHHRLINPITIIEEALVDATIWKQDKVYYMLATKAPNVQEKAYLYKSTSLFGKFVQVGELPIQSNRKYSRQGGNWFEVNNKLYRPAQDCVVRYGSALSIMKVDKQMETYKEYLQFQLQPNTKKYQLGLHTLNFHEGICVIDAYGYLYPWLGRVYYSAFSRKVIQLIKRVK